MQVAAAQDVGGLGRALPVAFHDLRAAYAELTALTRSDFAVRRREGDDLHIGRRQRPADRSITRGAVERIARAHGRCLAEAIALRQGTAGALLELALYV